jgi:hypothetical protein
MTTAAKNMVEVSAEELAELRKLSQDKSEKKDKSQARTKARNELIKNHRSEYDQLISKYSG